MKKPKKLLCILLVLIQLVILGGCQEPEFYIEKGNTGTTCANSVMSNGRFAYSNGFIYFSYFNEIFEYDLQSEKTVTFPVEDFNPMDMFTTDDYICYTDTSNGLIRVTKDGKKRKVILENEGFACLFADGMSFYYKKNGNTLCRRDLSTNEEIVLADDVLVYYMDDTYIYVISHEDKNSFLRSPKNDINFEEIELSFRPIRVYSHGHDLYFTVGGEGEEWQVVQYRDGKETRLPMNSYRYQILDNHLIYADEDTFKSTYTIKSYNQETGETAVLHENVFEFSIFEERYICFRCHENNQVWWELLDWQSGEMKRM